MKDLEKGGKLFMGHVINEFIDTCNRELNVDRMLHRKIIYNNTTMHMHVFVFIWSEKYWSDHEYI